jgi:hypothetical protein
MKAVLLWSSVLCVYVSLGAAAQAGLGTFGASKTESPACVGCVKSLDKASTSSQCKIPILFFSPSSIPVLEAPLLVASFASLDLAVQSPFLFFNSGLSPPLFS